MYNHEYYSGIVFQVVRGSDGGGGGGRERGRERGVGRFDCIAVGGRYDALIERYRRPSKRRYIEREREREREREKRPLHHVQPRIV